jgi:hypothetical protein
MPLLGMRTIVDVRKQLTHLFAQTFEWSATGMGPGPHNDVAALGKQVFLLVRKLSEAPLDVVPHHGVANRLGYGKPKPALAFPCVILVLVLRAGIVMHNKVPTDDLVPVLQDGHEITMASEPFHASPDRILGVRLKVTCVPCCGDG